MVVTANEEFYERMMLYRSHGLRRKKHYWHELPGHNFRLTNIQAALGCAQLKHLDKIIAERDRVYLTYQKKLSGIPGVLMQEFLPEVEPVVWAVAVRLDPKIFPQGRDIVLTQMLEAGIELRPGFYSPTQLDYFDQSSLPVCESLASSVISLPSYPTLTAPQITYICAQLTGLGHL
ncbi:MAG: DegT/DnrJ/EryC1/StrS family aminotransferase, partial [Gammaproteobacteria bacterium]|nr:DegT/DnrJ/EryC1/StrS family aminotransferase [Gammaproteobacteria bacterium]